MICKIGVRCSLVGSDLVCDERTNNIRLKKMKNCQILCKSGLLMMKLVQDWRKEKTRQDKTRQDKTRQDKGSILLPNLFVLTQQIVTEPEEVKAFFFELFFDISFLFFDCMLLTSYQLHLLMLMGSSEFH